MAVHVYHDGSGKSDNPAASCITLSGIAAEESVWKEVEERWERLLSGYGIESIGFHMTDFISGRGMYESSAWSEKQQWEFFQGAYNLLASIERGTIAARSASVMLAGYRRARSKINALRIPEAICVNFCVGGLQLPIGCPTRSPVVLYFDRNEQFLNTVNRVWLYRRKRAGAGFLKQIKKIDSTDRSRCPIQVADMLAWTVNNHHSGSDRWGGGLFIGAELMLTHDIARYDYEDIIRDYPKG